jgi:hypothetical protein
MALPVVKEMTWPAPSDPRRGFRWLTTRTVSNTKRERWLTNAQPLSMLRRDERIYRPLKDHTGLFLIFAELKPNEGDVVAFAGRFGSLLGDTGDEQINLRDNAVSKDPSALASAESIELWKREISDMKAATTVWRAVRDNNREQLEEFLRLNPVFAGAGSAGGWQSQADNPARLSLNYVQATVNARMERYVAIQLERDSSVAEPKVFISPKNLLGAMWLQFALAVEGRKEFRTCAQCHEPFEVSLDTTGRRTDARFCRGLCRVKHYRERIATARRLYQQGVSHREIAKKLDTDVKTVKVWVSNGEQKHGEETRS